MILLMKVCISICYKNYSDDIVCFYSDNDLYVKYEFEKEFTNTITENHIMIFGGGL